MSFKEAMQIVQCTDCPKSFPKMEFLNIHMKQAHAESDDMRIIRPTQMFEEAVSKPKNSSENESKIFDCGKCGLLFPTFEAQEIHNTEKHKDDVKYCDNCETVFEDKQLLTKHMEEHHDDDTTPTEKSEQYEIKIYPRNKDTEEDVLLNDLFGVKKKGESPEGITMKGKSIAFKDACIVINLNYIKEGS